MAKKKKKLWTKEECRIRYVQGDKIGQRALSKESGRHPTVIARWSKEDNWVQQREQYVSKVCAKTQEKTIEKTSERLSDELTKINEEHIKGLEFYRKLALQCTQTLANKLATKQGEDRASLVQEKDFALVLQKYAGVHFDALTIERMALGMQYLDINKAIETATRAGYEIFEPQED